MLEPGVQIDQLEILEEMERGGMARVFRVRHINLGSLHVLKVLDPSLVADAEMRKRFLVEGQIQAQLVHPNIARVTNMIIQPGVAGLVVDLVPGQTLDDWVASRNGPPTVSQIKQLFLPLLAGVGYAHSRGVVHRDIKPANIVVDDSDGELAPKILDFGIAKIVDAAFGGHAVKARTKTGSRLGTPNYMSPEQVRGLADVDARSDIFSLAATLYEVVTLQVPFDAPSDFDVQRRIVDGDLDAPRELVAGLDPVLDACIAKGLATDRAERFQSCAEFASLLDRAGRPSSQAARTPAVRVSSPVVERPEVPRAAPPVEVLASPSDGRPASFWGVVVLGALAMSLALALGVVLTRKPPGSAEPPPAPLLSPVPAGGQGANAAAEATAERKTKADAARKAKANADAERKRKAEAKRRMEAEAERKAKANADAERKRKAKAEQKAAEAKRRSSGAMVSVPAGEFWMGCAPRDSSCFGDEKPGRTVYLDAFRIDRTEVTVAQYAACVQDGVCSAANSDLWTCNWGKAERDDHPINCVDWKQARTYCRWAGKRLPTGAQWEKAARGTDGRLYPWGDAKASCRMAVMDDGGNGCGSGGTMPVGSRPAGASPYGALDMSGNVYEWVADRYAEDAYRSAGDRNPTGPTSGGSGRAIRGGCWSYDDARYLRSSYRNRLRPEYRNGVLGFRCVRPSP